MTRTITFHIFLSPEWIRLETRLIYKNMKLVKYLLPLASQF
ncbi:MAG: hypothetical protein ACOCV9_06440 [Marinilabiliaceae bacterium]